MLNGYKTKAGLVAIILVTALRLFDVIPQDVADTIMGFAMSLSGYGLYDRLRRSEGEIKGDIKLHTRKGRGIIG